MFVDVSCDPSSVYSMDPNMIVFPIVQSLNPGEKLHFSCAPGYYLRGSESAECMPSGRIAFPGMMQFCAGRRQF